MNNDTVERKSVRLRMYGRVQGVFFRAWTEQEAKKLGLAGWVRNRGDGSVEALLSGPHDAVDAMIERCRQGPDAARVDDIAVAPVADPGSAGFEIRPTV